MEQTITSMMEEKRVFRPEVRLSERADFRSLDAYMAAHKQSLESPEAFWAKAAKGLLWYKEWDQVLIENFTQAEHRWFVGGKINASENCVDRHAMSFRKNKAAIIWEGDIGDTRNLTYQQLYYEVNRFANVLDKFGIKKGDRVCIYLPMILELPVAMLACARIGAIHSVVFGGFSAEALRDRIQDSGARMLICADGYYRSGKIVRSKDNADTAVAQCPSIEKVVVVKRANADVNMKPGIEYWWHEEMASEDIRSYRKPEAMDAEDPLFILYTSGSTGKPKGVLHSTGGYLVYTQQTFKWVFDVKEEDTYWCTADIGWITGHSYIVYGPLAAGATTVMFEGVPTYPQPDRYWDIVERQSVSVFYTAPTALRSLMREGDGWVAKHDLSSLRILGSVGEPINPEAWVWYYHTIGKERCPIVDTWWQTETGGILISPLPGATPLKPGSATFPLPGIDAAVLREDGTPAGVNEGGYLVIRKPWPGLMRTVYGDPERFKKTYFARFPGVYNTGDGARVDEDGYFWLMGRIDDVIKVSGHRIGTAELESAFVSHPSVAEAAVVPMPHAIKGQGIYAFVTPKTGVEQTEELRKELIAYVRKAIGPIATPDKLQFADSLPKTRSGKIMRRILTRIASGDQQNLGDTTTLADPSVVETLIKGAS